VFRRRLIASRWTIGFTHRYEPDMGLRSQTILFVDDPLDILLFGHKHRENRKDERVVPWGTTPIVITPAAIDGALRLVEVGEYRIVPGEVEYPVAIE